MTATRNENTLAKAVQESHIEPEKRVRANGMDESKIQLFEDKRIRMAWDEASEEWLFSIVDVVGVLTEQPTQRGATLYWGKLKQRMKEEGFQLLTNCQQLKMKAADGKRYSTDVANTEQLLRVIQSIPSPKAEPFKLWLARVGAERIDETIERAPRTAYLIHAAIVL
jgi:hypothetical protein